MGKRTKQITTVIFLFIGALVSGQPCDKKFITVSDSSGCRIVSMSDHRFSEFYYAKINLEIIRDSLPFLGESLKKEREKTILIENSLSEEIDILNKTKDIYIQSLEDCTVSNSNLMIKNLSLQDDLKKSKTKNFKWFIGGVITAFTIGLLL